VNDRPNRYSRSQWVEASLTSCVVVEASLDRNRREQICQWPLSSCAHSTSVPCPSGPWIGIVRSAFPLPPFETRYPLTNRPVFSGSPIICVTSAELRALPAANLTGARARIGRLRNQRQPNKRITPIPDKARIAVLLTCLIREEFYNSNAAIASGQQIDMYVFFRRHCCFQRNLARPKKTSHGNDGVWKAWKAKKPAFHPSHTPWKSLWDFAHYHGYDDDYDVFEDRQSPPKTRNQSHSHRKGLVNHVSGLKRKGCPGTLRP
jgi:hypothetical protein